MQSPKLAVARKLYREAEPGAPPAQLASDDESSLQASLARVAVLFESSARGGPCFDAMVKHVLQAPGKRLRARLTLCFARIRANGEGAPRLPEVLADAIRAATAVELLHEASLVHDDICDASLVRRNQPSVAAVFGVRAAGWFGVHLAGRALELLAGLAASSGKDLDFGTLGRLAEGQLLELLGHDLGLAELREHYLRVASCKTGSLFELACTLGASLAGVAHEDLGAVRRFAHHWSIAFQVMDDVRDVLAPPHLGKPWGTDLRQGVPTWPLLEWGAIRGAAALQRVLGGQMNLAELRNDLMETQSIARSRSFALSELDAAEALLCGLGEQSGSRWLRELLREGRSL